MLVLNHDPEPARPVAPVLAVSVDVGLGKTRKWRENIVPALAATGRTGVLAVPRHRLGDEVVDYLAKAGLTARVYRGREADDPEHPAEKMCRELDRANLIMDALAPVTPCACKRKDMKCKSYDICGYQRQRRERPDVWIVPHQLLFRERPSFIPKPDSLAVDEAFWSAAIHGVERPIRLQLSAIKQHREVQIAGLNGRICDWAATADLMAISERVHRVLESEEGGPIRRAAFVRAGVTERELKETNRLEWRRKIEAEVWPGMPLPRVRAICNDIAAHNQLAVRLARFWELLRRTLALSEKRSPWIELRKTESMPAGGGTAPAVAMAWRDDIHPSWEGPTLVMDATMPVEIVRQFFPTMVSPRCIAAPMPHTQVRQIIDRAMTAEMLIPSASASERTNATRRSNVERVRRLIEVRAADVAPGNVLVVCQQGLEGALRAGPLPATVDIRHFNDIGGENAWEGVALVMVIGRTQPAPVTVERIARIIFGSEVQEITADARGEVRYPQTTRGIRLRNGRGVQVEAFCHPDPRVEELRWAICEAGLVQAIGRGRGINRSAINPLQIDILTNVVLPIEVDEVTTWDCIQPGAAEIMRARGAVPLHYSDMAAAYPDLFRTADAARMTLARKAKNPEQTPIGRKGIGRNPEQTPIEYISIGICSGFSRLRYRRLGSRGPAGTLLYDSARIDPEGWLRAHIGEVELLAPEVEELTAEAPGPHSAAAEWGFVEHCIRDAVGQLYGPCRAEVIRCDVGAPLMAELRQFFPVKLQGPSIDTAPEGTQSGPDHPCH